MAKAGVPIRFPSERDQKKLRRKKKGDKNTAGGKQEVGLQLDNKEQKKR